MTNANKIQIVVESIHAVGSGLGTLLLGFAACIALWQTSSVVNEILKVQEQAKNIDTAIALLSDQIKSMKAEQAIASSPVLQLPNPTKEEIEKMLERLPTSPTAEPSVYLPSERVKDTINLIYDAKTGEERKMILQKALEFNKGSFSSGFSDGFYKSDRRHDPEPASR
jgi:hypothetical protein